MTQALATEVVTLLMVTHLVVTHLVVTPLVAPLLEVVPHLEVPVEAQGQAPAQWFVIILISL